MPAWLTSLSRSLAQRLDRLRDTLDGLRDRLRQAVTERVGETVAGAVRDALQVVLAGPLAPIPVPYPPTGWRYRDPEYDDELDDLPDDHRSHGLYAEDLDDDFDDRDHDRSSRSPVTQPRWSDALATGCQAAAWCLRRPKQVPLLALGVGLAAASVGVLASVLGLPGLIPTVTSAVSLLTTSLS